MGAVTPQSAHIYKFYGFGHVDVFSSSAGHTGHGINYMPLPSSAREVWSGGYDVSLTR